MPSGRSTEYARAVEDRFAYMATITPYDTYGNHPGKLSGELHVVSGSVALSTM